MPLFILQLMISTAIITEEAIFVLITRNRQNTDISILADKRPNVPIAKTSETSEIKSSGVCERVRGATIVD